MPDLGPTEVAMLWSMLLTLYLGLPAVVFGLLAHASRAPYSRSSSRTSSVLTVVAIVLAALSAPGVLVFAGFVLGFL
jgi:hypothetical protein